MNYFKNIVLITLFIPKFSFGQKPVIGIKLGIALSNSTINYSNPDPHTVPGNTRTSVLGGVYLDIPSGKKIFIRPGCQQKKINLGERSKKIPIRTFTGEGINNETNWYYIRTINEPGENGYYLESKNPVKDFRDVNFIYYNMRPIEFKEQYLSNEKIILVDPKDLPKNIQHRMAELESLSISEEITDK